ncbi:glycosyltransferase family 4 protein [Natrialbaceae archaeon A-CW1-1]
MKLAYLADSIIPSHAANSIHVMKMCQAFAAHGNDVTLVVPDRSDREEDIEDIFTYYGVDPSFEVVKLARPNLSSLGTFLYQYRAGRYAKYIGADIAYGRSMFACYFASLAGIPTAFESHGPFTDRRLERSRQFFLGRLTTHECFLGFVVISDWLARYYRAKFPHINGHILKAHDGADPVKESVEPHDIGDPETLDVGYVGNLYPGRGIDLIIELARECPWAEFHVIGGTEDDVDYWRTQSDDVNNISFYGFIPPSELDAYRLAFDVLLAPYQKDLETAGGMNTSEWMSPLKLFEYMAAGKPIVCSEFPVLREVVRDGETALFCDPEILDQWVGALEELDNNASLRKELSLNAHEEFMENYTWERRAERIIEYLDHS